MNEIVVIKIRTRHEVFGSFFMNFVKCYFRRGTNYVSHLNTDIFVSFFSFRQLWTYFFLIWIFVLFPSGFAI